MLRNKKGMEGTARRRLGRGLESLVSKPVPIEVTTAQPDMPGVHPTHAPRAAIARPMTKATTLDGAKTQAVAEAEAIVNVPISSIRANRRQPRQSMDDTALESLAASIRQAGLMQPIVVRPHSEGDYEIVAGERRWRAAQRIGLASIPALVRNVNDRTAAELALVENIQREDLNAIDRAEAFERLINEFQITHQDLGERLGLDRSTVTNLTRLTSLDSFTREMVRTGKLSLGHAKVLLAITNDKARADLATRVVRQDWSVRELERHVQDLRASGGEVVRRPVQRPPAHLADLERRLGEHLGTKVRLKAGSKKGTGAMTIEFYTLDQFDGLMHRLGFAATDVAGH